MLLYVNTLYMNDVWPVVMQIVANETSPFKLAIIITCTWCLIHKHENILYTCTVWSLEKYKV